MTIQRATSHPDTCECELMFTWDDSFPNDHPSAARQLDHIVVRCSAHLNLANDTAVWDAVRTENPKKNIARQLLLDNAPSSVFDLDTDGQRVFKKGIFVSWAWTGTAPDRLLTITVVGVSLTTNQKNAIQTKLNERFGISNVVIQ